MIRSVHLKCPTKTVPKLRKYIVNSSYSENQGVKQFFSYSICSLYFDGFYHLVVLPLPSMHFITRDCRRKILKAKYFYNINSVWLQWELISLVSIYISPC